MEPLEQALLVVWWWLGSVGFRDFGVLRDDHGW